MTWALLTRRLARGKGAGELGLGGSPGGGGDRLARSGPRRVYETLGGVGRARRARLRVRSSPLVHGACGMGPAVACPASSSTWRRSKTSSVVFPSVFAAPRMIPVAPQRASPSHASRHGRRVSRSTGCARRSGGAARAALEGLPPAGDAFRTRRCASRRARSATKAPPRSPRGTRPSSAPSRPGATGAERGRTRTASPGSPELHEHSSSTPSLPAFLNFDRS